MGGVKTVAVIYGLWSLLQRLNLNIQSAFGINGITNKAQILARSSGKLCHQVSQHISRLLVMYVDVQFIQFFLCEDGT